MKCQSMSITRSDRGCHKGQCRVNERANRAMQGTASQRRLALPLAAPDRER
jgi:hypothetical protein